MMSEGDGKAAPGAEGNKAEATAAHVTGKLIINPSPFWPFLRHISVTGQGILRGKSKVNSRCQTEVVYIIWKLGT